MIKNYIGKFKRNSLFFKMFLVMVTSIVTVSICITFAMIQMSEKLFIDQFSITNAKVVEQITSNFENYSYSTASVMHQAQQSGTVKNFLIDKNTEPIALAKATYKIKQQMDYYDSLLNHDGVNIVLMGENNRSFSTNYVKWPFPQEILREHAITLNAYKNPNQILYQYASQDPVDTAIPSIVATKALMDRSNNHIYGVIYVSLRENDFRQMYSRYTGNGNDVYLMDQSGRVVSSNKKAIIGQNESDLLKQVKDIENHNLELKQVNVFNKDYLLFSSYLPTFDMYLINLIDRENVQKNLVDKKTIVFISAIIVLITLCIVFLISRRMTKSLSGLVKEISDMSKSNFDFYVTESGSYETKQLAKSFNYMLDELHEYVEQLIETQKKQRNAELEALQQQINPHFLYNTLASVKFMVQQGDREKSVETIHALISLLQNTIGNINETNTVEQELDNLKNYVYINQMRYGDRIKMHYFISPECLACEVPKLMIQPFIENAFFHGFNQKKEGYIQLLISQREEELLCEVVDNGDGMEIESRSNLPKSKGKRHFFSGIGILNVQERIQLLYGEKYGIEVDSILGKGTRIRIRLPVIKSK
ncbi:sensor histidine kinase [Lederbergia galactosidilytica]|nr:sensor histidine kinase [Lederbergia galactosidilytica]MBP1916409.1 two-component system sensor histidine kinase YesM [Lederbergia galactosidilytica]